MKKIIRPFSIFVLSFVIMVSLFAQELVPVDGGSAVKFTIKNFGISTTGTFSGLKGKILFNSSDVAASFFKVTVAAASIDTDIKVRDSHLKKEDYFDVNKYPEISFTSTKITASASAGAFLVTGNINIKGIVKEITFPFMVAPINDGFIFTGNFKVNRRDFNVGGNSFSLSDNLSVSLSVYAKKD
ncbi:MAG TPA: YceI family protein [Panacibacter sp.]|nr:YceI family protein [Panacibacter sp.]